MSFFFIPFLWRCCATTYNNLSCISTAYFHRGKWRSIVAPLCVELTMPSHLMAPEVLLLPSPGCFSGLRPIDKIEYNISIRAVQRMDVSTMAAATGVTDLLIGGGLSAWIDDAFVNKITVIRLTPEHFTALAAPDNSYSKVSSLICWKIDWMTDKCRYLH